MNTWIFRNRLVPATFRSQMLPALRQCRLPWLAMFALLLSSGLGTALLIARLCYSGRSWHLFLVWNLALAWMPLFFACASCLLRETAPSRKGWWFVTSCAWLLFLPNAPYLVTDFIHLRPNPPVPLWYDLLLLMVFAWTGVMLGFLSLQLMQQQIVRQWGKWTGEAFVVGTLALTSFGIYLGRFPRWNSWDALAQPLRLLADIGHRLFVPWEHPRTWGFTLVFFAFLWPAYLCCTALIRSRHWQMGECQRLKL